MLHWQKLSLSLMVACVLLLPGPLAMGQEASKTKASNNQTINHNQLRAFVKVYVAYHRIRKQYDLSLKNTQDPERKKIQDQANDKVKTALAQQNLTAEDYNRIFGRVNGNAKLRNRALKLIEEERKRG